MASHEIAAAEHTSADVVASSPVTGALTPRVLVATVAALNLLDVVSTQMVLQRGGREGNPLMEPFAHDVWRSVGIKGLCLLVIVALIDRCPRSALVMRTLVAVNLWYVVVVSWNIGLLLHLS
jgi:hypothetical protein